jgi:polysaccharide export outer membrane protein
VNFLIDAQLSPALAGGQAGQRAQGAKKEVQAMSKKRFQNAGRIGFGVVCLLAGAINLHAQQSAQTTAETAAAAATTSDSSRPAQPASQYRIGPRDVLMIRVAAPDIVAQFSADAMEVDECGMIPLLSVQNEDQAQVRAAGLTTGELQEQLRKFYTKYKRNPQVVVKVREYNSQPVVINGAVMKPGQFQMRRPVRLLELLTFYAGGPTEKSGGRIQIARVPALGECAAAQQVAAASGAQGDEAYSPQFLVLNLADTLKGDEKSNPYLQPGDVITLPEAKEAYVVGNVLRPGPIPLRDDHLTVSRAVAMAGGLLPDTKKEKLRIIRVDADGGNRREIPVDWAAIDKGKAEDIALLPNDIVDVPVAGGKRLLKAIIGSGATSAGQLPIRVIP